MVLIDCGRLVLRSGMRNPREQVHLNYLRITNDLCGTFLSTEEMEAHVISWAMSELELWIALA